MTPPTSGKRVAAVLRVLVVDDSALMRRHIGRILEQAGGFVVESCASGEAALSRLHDFAPDVVTLDVQMPGLDGLATLARLMVDRPCPVLMVSAHTDRGARTTLEALALGAVDYVTKPDGTISLHTDAWGPVLLDKVRAAAKAHVHPLLGRPTAKAPPPRLPLPAGSGEFGVVVIGASTGGPRALETILPALPGDFPWPVLVAQHMPANFTRLFAERMDRLCALRVSEVHAPTPIEAAVYVATGERDLRLSRRAGRVVAMPVPRDAIYPWHPSVDCLTESALEFYPPSLVIGVLLTGMGRDGATAMTRLRRLGGRTIAESADSAVVFGMPGELVALGGATCVLPASAVAERLVGWVAATKEERE